MGICCDATARLCEMNHKLRDAMCAARIGTHLRRLPDGLRSEIRSARTFVILYLSEHAAFGGVEHAQREARPHGCAEVERHPGNFFPPLRNVVRDDPPRADVTKSFQRAQHLVTAGDIYPPSLQIHRHVNRDQKYDVKYYADHRATEHHAHRAIELRQQSAKPDACDEERDRPERIL